MPHIKGTGKACQVLKVSTEAGNSIFGTNNSYQLWLCSLPNIDVTLDTLDCSKGLLARLVMQNFTRELLVGHKIKEQ